MRPPRYRHEDYDEDTVEVIERGTERTVDYACKYCPARADDPEGIDHSSACPMAKNRAENYPHVRAHLCQECGDGFEVGDELVALSDGFADEEMSYEVRNLRFFHADCWRNSQYMDTGTDQGVTIDGE